MVIDRSPYSENVNSGGDDKREILLAGDLERIFNVLNGRKELNEENTKLTTLLHAQGNILNDIVNELKSLKLAMAPITCEERND